MLVVFGTYALQSLSCAIPCQVNTVESFPASMFEVTYLNDKILSSCSNSIVDFLLKGTSLYLSNPARPKGEFRWPPFHSAAYRYVQALPALIGTIRFFKNEIFPEDGLTGFSPSEVLLTLTMTTTVVEVFQNTMKLFVSESGHYQKATGHHILARQLHRISQIRNLFLRSLLEAISQTPALAATNDSVTYSAPLQVPPKEDADVSTALQKQGSAGTIKNVVTAAS